jgi:hypothetical protein
MADIYLGLTDTVTNPLPAIRWTGGGDPGLPIEYGKQMDRATMLDGAQRFNLKSKHPRRWTLAWEMLTAAQKDAFVVLNEHNGALYFRNEWEDTTWRQVVMAGFEYEPSINLGPIGCRFRVSFSLEEIR